MAILEILGNASTITGLYDFVIGKFTNDHKIFCNQVKDIIVSVCGELRKVLKKQNSDEFFFPEDIEDVIYAEVIECIKTNRMINESELQRSIEVSDNMFKGLMEAIKLSLNESFEFCMRDYVAWSKQTLDDIRQQNIVLIEKIVVAHYKLDAIKSDTTQIIDMLTPKILRDELFHKSREYYGDLMSEGGRFAFIHYDESIFADVKRFEGKAKGVTESDTNSGSAQNVIECVLNSERHVLFVGDGGMGKSTSLLRTWEHEIQQERQDSKLPLYVPLNDFNRSDEKDFIKNYIKDKYSIDLQAIHNVNVLLLLDGFNEISKDLSSIVDEIKTLMKKDNIQVVLTSRFDFRLTHGFSEVEAFNLLPLEDDIVKTFLRDNNIEYDDSLLKILKNPMMLTLYANNAIVQKRNKYLECGIFEIVENKTVAEILQNYLTCQIARLGTAVDCEPSMILDAIIAIEHIAPYIAYQMESNGFFTISAEMRNRLLCNFGKIYSEDDYNRTLDKYATALEELNITAPDYDEIIKHQRYSNLITNRLHILIKEYNGYIFRHQYFRDYFSANYIINSLKKHDFNSGLPLPDVISKRVFPHYLARMIGECLVERVNEETFTRRTILHNCVDSLRNKLFNDFGYSLHNIINIWRQSRNDRIVGEDLSYLDLRRIPMNGVHFYGSNGQTSFEGGKISVNSLLPQGHSGFVNSAVYSPDGTCILSASEDKTIKIWDSESGECLQTLEGHSKGVNSAVYSPDATRILSASSDNTIKIWDNESGECLLTLDGNSGYVQSAVYSPDGTRILFALRDNTIKILDSKSGECLKTLVGHSNIVNSAVYSPDGTHILSASLDETIKIWDSDSGECLQTFVGYSDDVVSAVYSPDGTRILSVSLYRTINVWDSVSGKCLQTFGEGDYVLSAVYSPDGTLILSTLFDTTIKIWDSKSGKCLKILDVRSGFIHSAVYNLDGTRILFVSSDNTIKIWDSKSGECLQILEGYSGSVNSASYSPDGTLILSVSNDKTIKIWDSESGDCLQIFDGLDGMDHSKVNYSHDGKLMLHAFDNIIKISDVKRGECLQTLEGHGSLVFSAVYSPDSKRILSASKDKTIKIWDSMSGKCLQTLRGHSGSVFSAVYSSDGTRILSASWDSTIKIWDSNSGECLQTIRNYEGLFVIGCNFSDAVFDTTILEDAIRQHGGVIGVKKSEL